MVVYDAALDVKINVVSPNDPLLDTPAGILPATRDALLTLFSTQFNFFGLSLPIWTVILFSLVCAVLVAAQLRRPSTRGLYTHPSGQVTSAASVRAELYKARFAAPWVTLATVVLVFITLSPVSYAEDNRAGIKLETNPSSIVYNVLQGTATTETFSGTATVYTEAKAGYILHAIGETTGVNSPTNDVGFSIEGGDLDEPTLLDGERTRVKSHNSATTDHVVPFTFTVDIPRNLELGEHSVSLKFELESPGFPRIDSINPQVGPETGGTNIIIDGAYLANSDNNTDVTVGGQTCAIVSASVTQVECKVQAHAPGSVAVEVDTPQAGITSINNGFTYLPQPSVTGIFPERILANEPVQLTITGANFDVFSNDSTTANVITLTSQDTSSTFACTIVSLSDSQIFCDVMVTAVGNYTATVTTAGGTSVSAGSLLVQDLPAVSSLAPNTGPLAGGNKLIIYGTDFTSDGTTFVTVGDKPCQNISVKATLDEIECTVPAGDALGKVDVIVSIIGIGSSVSSSANEYTYHILPSIDPGSDGGGGLEVTSPNDPDPNDPNDPNNPDPNNPGDPNDPNNPDPNNPDPNNPDPNNPDPNNPNGGGGATANSVVVDLFGKYWGADATLTIHGSAFDDSSLSATSVRIDGIDCQVLTVTTTKLTCRPPAHSAGYHKVVLHTVAGDSIETANIYYLDRPTLIGLSANPLPALTASTITLTGTNFDNISAGLKANKVTLGAATCSNVTVDTSTTPGSTLTCVTPNDVVAGGRLTLQIETLAGSYIADGNSGRAELETVFKAAPAITKVDPNTGSVLGDTGVKIEGSDFAFDGASIITDVTVDGISVFSSLASVTDVSFEIDVPDHDAGMVDILVTTTIDTSANTAADNYTYLGLPSITSFSPTVVDQSGKSDYNDATAAVLTIAGVNFDYLSANAIFINDEPCPSTGTDTDAQLQCIIPAAAANTNLVVKVVMNNGTVSKSGFNYLASPTLTSISPNRGQSSFTNTVEIAGDNFDVFSSPTTTAVLIGAALCSSVTLDTVAPNSKLTCQTPDDVVASGPLDLTVTTLAGSFTLPAAYTYQDPPTIYSISPQAGNKAGGTVIHIAGVNLDTFDDTVDIITVGGTECTLYAAMTSTNIDCTVPAGTPGTADVVLDTPVDSSILEDAFTYLADPTLDDVTPDQGPTGGHSTLTITGTNFDDVNNPTTTKFFFDATEYPFTESLPSAGQCMIVSDTQVSCMSAGHAAGSVTITSTTNGVAALNPLSFLYANTPNWLSIMPNYGPVAGGTEITITGNSGLPTSPQLTDAEVLVGGNTCEVTFVSYTSADEQEIKCNTPASTSNPQAGWAQIETRTIGGWHPQNNAFNYLDLPTINITTNKPTPAYGRAGTMVTITGTNFDLVSLAGTTTTVVKFDNLEATCAIPDANTARCAAPAHQATYASGTPHPINITLSTGSGVTVTAAAAFDYLPVPDLQSVNPSSGPLIAAGKSFTINGTGFDRTYGSTGVTIDGKVCAVTNAQVNAGGTSLTCSLASDASAFGSSGAKTVRVSTAGGVASAQQYTVLKVPTITSVSPKYGAAGTTTASIVIEGNDFTGATAVKFGTAGATTFTVNNANKITATTPSQTAGTVDVTVTTLGGTSVNTDNNAKFDYMAAPSISKVENDATGKEYGPVGSTQRIKITGSGFLTTTNTGNIALITSGVTVAGTTCASVSVLSRTQLVCTAPALTTAGAKNVVVTSVTGQTSGTSGNGKYSYIGAPKVTAVSPNTGPTAAGTTQNITLSGDNFIDVTDVKFGSTSVGAGNFTVNAGSPVTITVKAPASVASTFPDTVNVVVVAVGGSSANNGTADDYTYVAQPTLLTISHSLTTTASKTVTLTGTGFLTTANTKVQVQGTSAEITPSSVTNGTSLIFTMPSKTAGVYTVKVITPGGTSGSLNYETLAVPSITSIIPGNGSTAGGTTVRVYGKNFFKADGTTAISTVFLEGVANGTDITVPVGANADGYFYFKTPAYSSAGGYHVRVTTAGGTSAMQTADIFDYRNTPVVTSIRWSIGGATATYVKQSDTVYIYADHLCQSSLSILSGGSISGTPLTLGSVICSSATNGYVAVTLPNKTQSMTTQYDVQINTSYGSSAANANTKLIYPPQPTISAVSNSTYGANVSSSSATTNVVLTGANFRPSASGSSLVRSLTIDSNTPVTAFTVAPDATGSITGITIPSGLSVGTHTIKVETYGGVSQPFDFAVLATPTITFPTSSVKAYMWQTGSNQPDEPFNITGTGFSSFSTVTIAGAAAKANSCTYVNSGSITNCDINRSGATAASAEADYTVAITDPVSGSASQADSLRIEQVSPTAYRFVGGTQFNCANLIAYEFPNTSTSTYHTAIVNDFRNNQKYRVRKLNNGQCWMIDNLKIANTSISSANSDNTGYYTIPAPLYDIDNPQVIDATDNCSADDGGTPTGDIDLYMPHSQTSCGYFYSFLVATAGWGVQGATGTSPQSICPAGWHLPKAGVGTTDYSAIFWGDNIFWRTTGTMSSFFGGEFFRTMGFVPSQTGQTGYWWGSNMHPSISNRVFMLQVTSYDAVTSLLRNPLEAIAIRCLMN